MPLSLNPNLWPDGGWFFKDADGVKHTANSYDNLIRVVVQYRERRGIPVGDATTEVTVQLCGRNRGFCKDSNPAPIPTAPSVTLMLKVLNFLQWLIQEKRLGHLRLIDRNVALARAHICAQCPRQQALPTTCGSCKESVSNTRRAILDGQEPVHAGIQVCSVLEEDAATVVHVAVPQRHDEGLPAACWRRNC